MKLHPFFAELVGPPVAEPAPPPLVDWWRLAAGAVFIAGIVAWAHFLVQPVRADAIAFNLVAHVCQGDACRDHVEPMAGLYACQARARAIEELAPEAWSAKIECVVVRGRPEA